MNKSLFKYKGHEIVFSGTDYGDVRDSDKCRLCGCSWSAAEMLYECEGRRLDALNEHKMTFVDACLAGEARPQDVEGFIGRWQRTNPDAKIIDILGMTPDEYCVYLQNMSYLFNVLGRRAVARAQKDKDEA